MKKKRQAKERQGDFAAEGDANSDQEEGVQLAMSQSGSDSGFEDKAASDGSANDMSRSY